MARSYTRERRGKELRTTGRNILLREYPQIATDICFHTEMFLRRATIHQRPLKRAPLGWSHIYHTCHTYPQVCPWQIFVIIINNVVFGAGVFRITGE